MTAMNSELLLIRNETEPAPALPDGVPTPGIYPNVVDETYRAWKLMSPSMLWHGHQSMLQLKAVMDGKVDTESDDKKFGRHFHVRILEPARFKADFVAMPEFEKSESNVDGKGKCSQSKATNWYKAKAAEFESQHEGLTPIDMHDWETIEAMARRVYAHKAVKLFHAAGGCEVSMVGTLCGLQVRGRVDKLITEGKYAPTIIDVKKCRSINEHTIQGDCLRFGYFMKAAFYVDLAAQHIGAEPSFVWVYIADSYPHDVVVWQAQPDDIAAGRAEYINLLNRYQRCLESNDWPGRCGDILQDNALPEWFIKQLRNAGILEK